MPSMGIESAILRSLAWRSNQLSHAAAIHPYLGKDIANSQPFVCLALN